MHLTFDFIGPIDDNNIITLRNFIESHEDIADLTINISSLGGTTYSGITIYNYLKRQEFPIHTHNLGEVSSAAILLYLSGTTRTASEVSKFMIHPISMGVSGELSFYNVKERLSNLESDIKNYAKIVNKETNNLNGLCDVEQYLKGDNLTIYALEGAEYGIVREYPKVCVNLETGVR